MYVCIPECKCVLTVPMRNGNLSRNMSSASFNSVLTVPMRNGNNFPCQSSDTQTEVLTVPMRNGNKKIYISVVRFCEFGSYRTYEEWKQDIPSIPSKTITSSYRTYEEWKQCTSPSCCPAQLPVLTVPMRNGNLA